MPPSTVSAARRAIDKLRQELFDATDPAEQERLNTAIGKLTGELNQRICREAQEVGWWYL